MVTIRTSTYHAAIDGYHAGEFASCPPCNGAKPCVADPACTGYFHPDAVRMDFTGWSYATGDNSPVHDCRTEDEG